MPFHSSLTSRASRAFSSSPTLLLRRILLRPQRPQTRLSSSGTTPPPSGDPSSQASRLDRILQRTLRFVPRRFHNTLRNLRAAPASHVVAFLVLHEVTAVAPIVGLFAFFHYRGIVPVDYVFGPWAPYIQEEAFKFLRWFKRKGWFGLGEGEANRRGEEEFEEDIGRQVREEKQEQQNKTVVDGQNLEKKEEGFLAKFWGKRDEKSIGDESEAATTQQEHEEKSKAKRAVALVKDKVTLHNTEAGYKIGVQLVAAYAITKMLLIPRIALSVWMTPPVARAMVWARKAVFRR
ncbi:hypothetical protein BX600DRAFT_294545 [Xylariales sp. PMI_506]|nr:hypothetical protein BX600DRAFT_294545 [Xylariales sp. PMI_506]